LQEEHIDIDAMYDQSTSMTAATRDNPFASPGLPSYLGTAISQARPTGSIADPWSNTDGPQTIATLSNPKSDAPPISIVFENAFNEEDLNDYDSPEPSQRYSKLSKRATLTEAFQAATQFCDIVSKLKNEAQSRNCTPFDNVMQGLINTTETGRTLDYKKRDTSLHEQVRLLDGLQTNTTASFDCPDVWNDASRDEMANQTELYRDYTTIDYNRNDNKKKIR
jgi:hypothetical protein